VGVHEELKLIPDEDVGEVTFFALYVLIGEIGKKLDKSYRCPTYCMVDHKHIYWEIKESPVDSLRKLKKVLAYND
tara:strand:+ start:206 stop:430 length:225 start_codon:yes stop_codon:yes gene_type:complete